MSDIYLKIVDAEVTFTNSFEYTSKQGDKKTKGGTRFIHTFGIKVENERGRVSRFLVKTFDNKKKTPLADVGDFISLTGEIQEEKWQDDKKKWVSRVTIIADNIELTLKAEDLEDDDEDDEEEDDDETKKKAAIRKKK